jgi:RND family efflux transporter MFP subunit
LKKRIIIVLFLLIALGGAGYFGANYYFTNVGIKEVEAEEVKKMDLPVTVVASHEVVAKRKVEITSLLSGKISEIKVSEGKKVKKDELLLLFDKRELEYQVAQAEGAYDAAVAQRDKMKKAKDNNQATEEDVKAAEGQVKQAKAALDLAKLNLERAEIRAPIDGVVSSIKVEAGLSVAAGTPLITIVDPNSYVIRAEVDETDIGKVKKGAEVRVTLDAFPQKSYLGKVKKIGLSYLQTETGARVFPVEIEITGINLDDLREGMSGDAEITVDELKDVLVVPPQSVLEDGSPYVFVIDEDEGVVRKRRVTLGYSTEDYVEVKKGLKEGELVVVAGAEELKDGERVIW